MLLKILVIVLLLVIVYCLGSAALHLVKRDSAPESIAKALSWRIGISVLLFLFLILTFSMGWVHPHDILLMHPQPKS